MLTRREFLKLCGQTVSGLALTNLLLPELARAFPLRPGQSRAPIIWLECDTCAGDILSLTNAAEPGLEHVLFELISLEFDQLLTVAQGQTAVDNIDRVAAEQRGNYILVIEGTLPRDEFAIVGQRNGAPISARQAAKTLAAGARYTVAAGTCAAFGGIYAARPNPTDSRPASYVVPSERLINVPGCPVHPDWLIGTLTHILLYGLPDLDRYRRPRLFFGRTIHELCPRRTQFEQGQYAVHPGDDGCYYKIGCKGPVTEADCPVRAWNNRRNWPIGANTPCIGCTSYEWPEDSGPFFAHLPDAHVFGQRVTTNQLSLAAGAVIGGGIALHLGVTALTGRLKENHENPGADSRPAPARKLARRRPQGSVKIDAHGRKVKRRTRQAPARPGDDKGGDAR